MFLLLSELLLIIDLLSLECSRSDYFVDTESSSRKNGFSRISFIVGRLCGVTLKIDLIKLISSAAILDHNFTKPFIKKYLSFHLIEDFFR